jgi:hypothetical protein
MNGWHPFALRRSDGYAFARCDGRAVALLLLSIT